MKVYNERPRVVATIRSQGGFYRVQYCPEAYEDERYDVEFILYREAFPSDETGWGFPTLQEALDFITKSRFTLTHTRALV